MNEVTIDGESPCSHPEQFFRLHLKNHGFVVSEKDVSTNGFDIIAIKEGRAFIIEVITIEYSENRARVSSAKKGSDFIMCVSRDGWFFPFIDNDTNMAKLITFFKLLHC